MQKQLLGLKHLLIENHHFIFSSGYALTTGTYLIPTFQRLTNDYGLRSKNKPFLCVMKLFGKEKIWIKAIKAKKVNKYRF